MKKDVRDTILVVDDEEVNRAILFEMFKDEYNVIEADNGLEAMEMIEKHKDSLVIVLLDLIMPERSGFDVLEMMHDTQLMTKVPVVLITGDNTVYSERMGYEYGVSDIIRKPFDPSIVIRRVGNVIDLYLYKNQLERLVKEQQITIDNM